MDSYSSQPFDSSYFIQRPKKRNYAKSRPNGANGAFGQSAKQKQRRLASHRKQMKGER